MDPTLPQVAPKKFPSGLIIGGIVVSLVIIIAVGLWLLGFFDTATPSPGPSGIPGACTPVGSTATDIIGGTDCCSYSASFFPLDANNKCLAAAPWSTPPPPQQQPSTPPSPQQQPSTPPSPQQQPQQQPSTSSPAPSTCPPGYNLNTSNSPGYDTAAPIGLDSNYCVMTLTKPSSVSSWPLCPPNNTGPIQYDSVHENCYVPKVG